MIDKRFFEEVFVAEIYKPVRDRGIVDTVIDAGATTGEFSLWMYPQANQIFAIEPEFESFCYLKENVRDLPKIKPFNLALSDNNGIGILNIGGNGGNALKVIDENPNNQEVITKTLATFMNENTIAVVDVLKIDIEDGEKEVFKSSDFKGVANRINFIIGEHLTSVKGLLKSLGFKHTHYEHGRYFEKRQK